MNSSIIKKLLGIVLFYSGFFYLYSLTKKIIGEREVTILMYHRIVDNKQNDNFDSYVVSSNQKKFEEQMRYLSKNCNVVTFDEFLHCCKEGKRLAKNSVIITFDDGYKDNYKIAYPILKKYKLSATILLTTGHINNKELFWWDKIAYIINKTKIKKFRLEDLGTVVLTNKEKTIAKIQEKVKKMGNSRKDYLIDKLGKKLKVRIPKSKNLFLSWKEVREMSKNNISFGAHTVSHPILTRISLKQAKEEIMNSKNKIEKETNKQVSVFAYPNGCTEDMSRYIDKFLKENSFSFALSTIPGVNKSKKGLFRLKRRGIEHNDNLRLFKIKLSGLGSMLAPLYLKLLK